jgi:hypothetical protein
LAAVPSNRGTSPEGTAILAQRLGPLRPVRDAAPPRYGSDFR